MSRIASPFLGLGHLRRLRHDQLGFYRDIRARHGDAAMMRLGPYRVWLLFHPDAIETVLATRADSFIRFEPVMRVLAQWNGTSLLIAEGERWRARRRQVLPAFATRRLPGYGAHAAARAAALGDAWRSAGPAVHDTDHAMAQLTLEVAAETLFGEALGARAEAVGAAVASFSAIAFQETTSPLRLPDWLPFPAQRRKRAAMALMEELVTGIVTRRMTRPDDDRGDLMSTLVAHSGGDARAVRDEVMTLLIAGHETSGALLAWTCEMLARHPAALASVTQELDAALDGRLPRAEDLPGLPMLRAVVAETLRLWPPAYALFPRRAVEEVEAGDATIRRGDIVQIVPWATQRDPRWFNDPTSFRPERFLAAPAWPRYAYLPFGAGPRMCIGQGFGLMEVGLMLAALLQRVVPVSLGPAAVPDAKFSLRPRGGLSQRWMPRSARG